MLDHSLPRRTVLKAGLGALATLGLPACSTDDDNGTTANESTATDASTIDPAAAPDGNTVPAPAGMVRTSWSTDPFTYGSYSYLPVGATPQHRADLATPVDDRLFFAGEALDPDNPSTVHGALASGLAAAALANNALDPGSTIVVVGAGIAGAAAARQLTDDGHTVIVVEAQQRVGGRTNTVRSEGWPVPVERGASWVHNTDASDLAAELAALHVATAPFEYDDIVLDPNGTLTDGAEDAVQAAIDWAEGQDTDLSLADALQQSGAAGEADPASLQHFLHTELSTEYGADADELSAWWGTAEGSEGDDLLVLGGYDTLVTTRLEGLDVQLDWPVATIDTGSEQVVVTHADGETITADAVIITVPLGVLKAGTITFTPALPAAHATAIDTLGMGLLDKVWLRWDEPWWSQSAQQWTRVADGEGDAFIEWFNLLDVAGAPVLLGLIGAAEARAWAERSDDDVLAACLASLQQFRNAGW
jgi:monoamine oxidase